MNRLLSAAVVAAAPSLLAAQTPAAPAPPPAAAPAAAPAAELKRPNYQVLRYNEDWSVLKGRDTSATGDFFDPVKYIALDADGWVWMSFGGQIRERVEYWNNFNFGAQPAGIPDQDVFLLSRVMMHGDFHFGPNVRIFAEGKSALTWDRDLAINTTQAGPRTLDTDAIDLQNAFVDLILPFEGKDKFTFRAGRQELLFGNQRLVGPLDWTNTRRTFDGFSGIFNVAEWTVTGFWTRAVPVDKYELNDSDSNTAFYGVHASGKVPTTDIGLDLYWLRLESAQNAFPGTPFQTFNGTTGRDMRHTVGGRLFGKVAGTGFDYEVEGAYQFGDHGGQDIDAFAVTGNLGYTFADIAWTPRVYGMIDYATGDEEAGGDVQTFSQLFPTGHLWLGYMDTVGRQNIIDASTGVSFKPTDKLTVLLDLHFFWREEDADALYNAGAGVVRAGSTTASDYIGSEIDLTLRYQLDRHITLMGGYSHFFAGGFIEETTGPSDDMDWLYMSVQFTF